MKGLCVGLAALLGPLRDDERLGPTHVCIYLALMELGGGGKGWFFADSKKVMGLAKVKGKITYYRALRLLVELGYVEYQPSRNGKTKSRVRLIMASN